MEDQPVKLQRIAVDLTPVLPGGENGGAKLMTLGLIRHLSRLASEIDFVLLTGERSHSELSVLDAPNVRRVCVAKHSQTSQQGSLANKQIRGTLFLKRLSDWMVKRLSPGAKFKLQAMYHRGLHQMRRNQILTNLQADLLFCPFTAPLFWDPAVPTVSVIYDLQYVTYPGFFSPEDRKQRDRNFRDACRAARRLVCISDYVRETVLANAEVKPEHVKTVHIRLPHRVHKTSSDQVTAILRRFGLKNERFFLYPANFWLHKNHQMLLTAFGMFVNRYPELECQLVCPGALEASGQSLRTAVVRMKLEGKVVFPGFISDHEFAALLQSCRAVLFPSLYEGFGMPVLEAMAFGKPVLCSNVTSLPEVAGDAAFFFDPRKPIEIVEAMYKIGTDAALTAQLVDQGLQRAALFSDTDAMARQYLHVFQEAIGRAHYLDSLHGVYADGWTGDRMVVTYAASVNARVLHVTLALPAWAPFDSVSVQAIHEGRTSQKPVVIKKGQQVVLQYPLPAGGGVVELHVHPVFQPRQIGLNSDSRFLGCLCRVCHIVESEHIVDLLPERK
jgi:glycosyltransferase involved in cell wall biosynthesis